MSIQQIVDLSRVYGSDPEWVLAGGGNTSFKDSDVLYVKASGFPLATISGEGFARMDRAALNRIWSVTYPAEVDARESAALADLMAARVEGEQKRPSVETLMHELIPYSLVVHTHPALVNGVTCSQEGAVACERLFGNEALWIPAIEPGYILARAMYDAVERYKQETGAAPRLILMQNHGLVVAADTPAEIEHLHDMVTRIVRDHLERTPDMSTAAVDEEARDLWHRRIAELWPQLQEAAPEVVFDSMTELRHRVESAAAFAPLEGAFTPDHIVYAGEAPMFVPDGTDGDAFRGLVEGYRTRYGDLPRIVAVERLGAFAVAESLAGADSALLLFLDEVKIAAYSESFGGPRHLDDYLVAFIKGWEVERYRKKTSTGGE